MSISECIADWLRGYTGDAEIINIDQLPATPEAYGLFRAPDTIVTPYINGARSISAYYTFVIRRQSQTDAARADNADEIEDIERWIYAQYLLHNLPVLDKGRVCNSVSVTGGMAIETQDETTAEYQIIIHINYDEGRDST